MMRISAIVLLVALFLGSASLGETWCPPLSSGSERLPHVYDDSMSMNTLVSGVARNGHHPWDRL